MSTREHQASCLATQSMAQIDCGKSLENEKTAVAGAFCEDLLLRFKQSIAAQSLSVFFRFLTAHFFQDVVIWLSFFRVNCWALLFSSFLLALSKQQIYIKTIPLQQSVSHLCNHLSRANLIRNGLWFYQVCPCQKTTNDLKSVLIIVVVCHHLRVLAQWPYSNILHFICLQLIPLNVVLHRKTGHDPASGKPQRP